MGQRIAGETAGLTLQSRKTGSQNKCWMCSASGRNDHGACNCIQQLHSPTVRMQLKESHTN